MKKTTIALVLFLFALTFSHGQTVLIRSNASVGYISADDINEWAVDYGIKLLLFANESQRFGILADHLLATNNNNVSYLCTGLMLEQVLFKYFIMGIGTIGYINTMKKGENPFGIYTHLGFKYNFSKYFGILASYRCDFIFRNQFTMYNAFNLGLNLYF